MPETALASSEFAPTLAQIERLAREHLLSFRIAIGQTLLDDLFAGDATAYASRDTTKAVRFRAFIDAHNAHSLHKECQSAIVEKRLNRGGSWRSRVAKRRPVACCGPWRFGQAAEVNGGPLRAALAALLAALVPTNRSGNKASVRAPARSQFSRPIRSPSTCWRPESPVRRWFLRGGWGAAWGRARRRVHCSGFFSLLLPDPSSYRSILDNMTNVIALVD
jgi:hypothetical protein